MGSSVKRPLDYCVLYLEQDSVYIYLHLIILSCGYKCRLVFVLFGVDVVSSICEIKFRGVSYLALFCVLSEKQRERCVCWDVCVEGGGGGGGAGRVVWMGS